MTVKLTGNFLATARCLIYLDGNAITWTFDPNTNELTAAYTGAGSAGSHNPTATIGLTAVNGTAATWMTSDSAPALSQAITPTWTGAHIFSSNVTLNGELIDGVGSAGTSTYVLSSTGTGVKWVAASSGGSGTVTSVTISSSGSTINVTGTNPITTSGTVNVDVNSVSYDSFILGLPAASALTGAEVVAVEQSGAAVQTTTAAMAALASTQFIEAAGWNSTSAALLPALTVPQDILIPYGCTLQEVYITTQGAAGSSVSGSCTVTLQTAAFPTPPATDITGGTPPAIASASSYSNTALTGWTKTFAQGALIRATLTANSSFYSVKIHLRFA